MKTRRFLLLSLVSAALPLPLLAQESEMAAGARAFFSGKIDDALQHWDRQIEVDPEAGPHHWQRGLALYYAGKFKEGRAQFESHQTVNPQDVENAAWHFLCVAKLENVEAARKAFIPITYDPRVPMKEIHALFAGKGTEADVLAAAEKEAAADPSEARNARCYAHLYLGLYAEALGREAEAKTHLLKAAHDYRMEHYMGRVAQVHCQLRGWKPVGK
jgi:lipoprotein NlpI